MNGMEFTDALVGHVLSWPVLVLAVILIFRKPLRELLGRIKSAEVFGQKVDFRDKLEQAEKTTDAAVREVTGDQAPVSLAGEIAHNPIATAVGSNPSYAMLASWEMVQEAVVDLRVALEGQESNIKRRDIPMAKWLRVAAFEERVPSNLANAVSNLNVLRNQVAHGQHNPTAGEASAYFESALELSRAAKDLTARAVSQQQAATRPSAGAGNASGPHTAQ